ncbi:YolD-like family protein [Bacillus sp. EB01]|uniref:YolD-like family protein n=1 Tax=Bacillus sp. EB01 TaxID=1347086 RepID=UPI0005C769FF|nr:YolD-like family protein [Bacillus sp. EB01]
MGIRDRGSLECRGFEEIEENILFAMEFAIPARIKIWDNRFFKECRGMIHRLDEINKVLYLETEEGRMIKITFSDIIEAFSEDT